MYQARIMSRSRGRKTPVIGRSTLLSVTNQMMQRGRVRMSSTSSSSLRSVSVTSVLQQENRTKFGKASVTKSKLTYAVAGPSRLCLNNNFKFRGWTETSLEKYDWNLLWCAIGRNGLFRSIPIERLKEGQYVNHFPQHRELSHKDRLYQNMSIYKFVRLSKKPELKEELDFLPQTFILPRELSSLEKEFNTSPLWIMKPNCKARGRGISIVNEFSKVQEIVSASKINNRRHQRFVISKYIQNPLLLNGKKFDLRVYVLVRSFQPLIAYMYNEGFARMCSTDYSADPSTIQDLQTHLTNIAVQKQFGDVSQSKILISELKNIFQDEFGAQATTKLFKQIDRIVYHSLYSCQTLVDWDPNCFELFGYDIMIDQNLKPWLIEVNASPSLHSTSKLDLHLKTHLINDILNIVVPPPTYQEPTEKPSPFGKPTRLGGFRALINETIRRRRNVKRS